MIELWHSTPEWMKLAVGLPLGVFLFALLTADGDMGGTG